MLKIEDLVKSFDGFSLGPIKLELQAGIASGLVGANGSGKTTLFRTIMGTLRRNAGSIEIAGQMATSHSGDWKKAIGYVGDATPLFENWSGRKNLSQFAPYYENWSLDRTEQLARRLQLDLTLAVKNYSTGQRTKLAIILALAHKPTLLLLDEPTSGLDPVARDTFMEILFEARQNEQLSVLYATHYIAEIEQLADEISFIDEGQILRSEIKDDLTDNWRRIAFRFDKALGEIPGTVNLKTEGYVFEVITDQQAETLSHLERIGAEAITASRLSLEQISVQILRKSAGISA